MLSYTHMYMYIGIAHCIAHASLVQLILWYSLLPSLVASFIC